MSERDRLISGPVTVSSANHTQVSVQDVGRSVDVGTAPHMQANHFIKQTRKYFPRSKLRTYLWAGFSQFRAVVSLIYIACSLGALSILGGDYKIVPGCLLVLAVVWIAVFAQHEVVNRKTLPVVFRQPTINGQRSLNAFYRVTVTELSGLTLENYRAGIGYVQLSGGSVEFQAFNRQAIGNIKRARVFSRGMLYGFTVMALLNIFFLIADPLGLIEDVPAE